MVPAQCTNCGETARTFWREAMSLATRTVCDGCGQEVVKRGRSRETVAGIIFVLVMALSIAGAREGLGLRLGLACLAYLIYLEWWTWHAVVWDVESGELDDDATTPAEPSGGAGPAASG